MNGDELGFVVMTVFVAGGLFAYLREWLKLHRLRSRGIQATATVVRTRRIDTSESVSHLVVTYVFVNGFGALVEQEEDLNDTTFFESLRSGSKMQILYEDPSGERSYPFDQVVADERLARLICLGLAVFWLVMAAYLL